MGFKLGFASALFLLAQSVVNASPASVQRPAELEKRFNVLSGQWDTENFGNVQYTLYNNLFGRDTASSGSQTTQALSYSGTTISWKTQYSWTGGQGHVKSYANVALFKGLGKQISAIKSIPTTWKWTYNTASNGLIADVSYDLWLSGVSNGTGHSKTTTYEIMIWVGNRGATPAGVQIATATVAGRNWKLYKGTVETWTVFSFVAPSDLTNYSGDLKEFLNYLTSRQGVSTAQYVVGAQAGTEPFEGSATLTTTGYTIAIN